MRLTNHIAYRFLTDDTLAIEIIQKMYHLREGKFIEDLEGLDETSQAKAKGLWALLNKKYNKAFLVTDTVHDKLDMLKVGRDDKDHYDWTVFKEIEPSIKHTYILKPHGKYTGGGCLRIRIVGDVIEFCHLSFAFDKGSTNHGNALWTLFYINRKDNTHAEHCEHKNVKDIYEFVYKLMCFVFLSENDYEIVKPGMSRGTKKHDKFKNDLPVNVTIINSKWNITVIRTEGFLVRGHFRLQNWGTGRMQTKMIYIEPFEKHGYVRRAANQINN